MTPAQIGRYMIKAELGRGGMATVFRAYDPHFKRDVAIKVLPREFLHDPTWRARFEREAHTIAALEHTAIVPVYDFGEEDGQPYLVMRYMPGGSLADQIKRGPMSLNEAAHIIERIASALDEAHEAGVIHRDLKPANVLLDKRGDPFLSDFGIVKLSESSSALTGSAIVGTPAYISPEQVQDSTQIDGRSDVYSLGVILFEMLTGQQPYTAETPIALVVKHLQEPVPNIRDVRPGLPEEVEFIIARALAKDPDARYQTGAELAQAVLALVSGEPLPSRPLVSGDEPGTLAVAPPDLQPTRPAREAEPTVIHRQGIPVWLLAGGAVLAAALIVGGLALGGVFGGAETAEPKPTLVLAGSTEEPVEATPGGDTDEPTAIPDESTGVPLPTPTPPSYTGPIPAGAQARLGKGTISTVDLAPDGSRLAIGGGIGVYMYDASSFDELWVAQTTGPASSVAFSPDGSVILVGLANGAIIGLDTGSGEQQFAHTGQTSLIATLAWSPDGATFASGSSGGVISLWNVETGHLSDLRGHTAGVLEVAFSPDGERLASGASDNTVMVWDVQSGERLHTLREHRNWVFGVAWAADGETLVSGSFDGTVIFWDVEDEEPARTLEGHGGGVLDVAFSPDGTLLASGDSDGAIILWDARFGDLLRTVRGHTNWVIDLDWSPDSARLFSGSFDSTVITWEAGTGERLHTLKGHTDWVSSLVFSPDGSSIISGAADKVVTVWDLGTNTPRLRLEGHTDWVNSVAVRFDGTVAASASSDKTVILWNLATGELLHRLEGHDSRVNGVAFSPNGRTLASAGCGQSGSGGRCTEGVIMLWDVETGRPAGEPLEGHGDAVLSVAWSPDGERIASGSRDGTVILWDAGTGEALGTPVEYTDEITALTFSPDGDSLAWASADGKVFILNLETRALVTLVGHTAAVNGLAFSPDGSLLASGSDDNAVILWNTQTGERLVTLSGHNSGVQGVAFSPDSTRLASGSADGTILLWGISP